MPYEKKHVTPAGMESHGWTESATKRFLGEPDCYADNPYYRSGFAMRLYDTARVLAFEATEEFQSWLKKKLERKANVGNAREDRFANFDKKYGSWKDALPDACRYLFELNHYSKHDSCTDANRDDIYDLKNQLVALLYRNGYSTDCYFQKTELPAQSCWSCDGTGLWHSYRTGDSDECRKCDGTGVYREAKTLTFICFRFGIGSETYCWHQPDHLVKFAYTVTCESSVYELTDEEKPVTLSSSKFAEAKDLLRWVLGRNQVVSIAA